MGTLAKEGAAMVRTVAQAHQFCLWISPENARDPPLFLEQSMFPEFYTYWEGNG